jgi:hypothetical protein
MRPETKPTRTSADTDPDKGMALTDAEPTGQASVAGR